MTPAHSLLVIFNSPDIQRLKVLLLNMHNLDGHGLQDREFNEPCLISIRYPAEATITDHLKGFQRWGIMADWNNVYKTMDPEYEAAQLRIFSEMMERGRIFRGLRPVYWYACYLLP